MLLAVLVAFALPSVALAAFPGTDPSESPRVNTPNDPGFDPCEADDMCTDGDTPGRVVCEPLPMP